VEALNWFLVDFFQAFAAGLMVGGTYGLMCVGLGIIFGVMRVVNFAQGDFMMVGMYIAYYLVTGFGVLAFLGPYAAPIVGAVLAGPIVFVVGWLLHRFLIAHVTGARVVSAEAEGHYTQIILTLGVALGRWEEESLRRYARQIQHCQGEMRAARRRLVELTQGHDNLQPRKQSTLESIAQSR